ncbi:hypothetical protein DIPPA_33547 [Diplonema papillatum]|nr:hypothetical protein DIPPA_33547 [Diplonema papillatum]
MTVQSIVQFLEASPEVQDWALCSDVKVLLSRDGAGSAFKDLGRDQLMQLHHLLCLNCDVSHFFEQGIVLCDTRYMLTRADPAEPFVFMPKGTTAAAAKSSTLCVKLLPQGLAVVLYAASPQKASLHLERAMLQGTK